MNKLTQKRIKEILTDFCSKWVFHNYSDVAKIEGTYYHTFDGGFMETTVGCEDEMIDDDSDSMKRCLIGNYLMWYGYDYVLEDNPTAPTQEELINKYLNQ
tara:strand:+ start:1482 stop:1781 length:300 start_codon:yes stop_codon:yes gene_type:complete